MTHRCKLVCFIIIWLFLWILGMSLQGCATPQAKFQQDEMRRLQLESAQLTVKSQEKWIDLLERATVKIDALKAENLVSFSIPPYPVAPIYSAKEDDLKDLIPYLKPVGEIGKELLPILLGIGAVK